MKYIAAYLLARAGGDAAPTAAKVRAILESIGASIDEQRLNEVVNKMNGKNIEDLIEEGSKKMISVGAVMGGAAPAAAGAAAPADEKPKEEEKEEEAAAPLDLGDMFDF